MALLDKINSPEDIRKLNQEQLKKLAQEIRSQLIATVSKNGGHLAPNLGVVELTLALHKVFNTPRDKLVWDVGHQSYVHKLITGRREDFHSLRKYGGLSGFPKPLESPHDAFATGHSSTSLSVALGLALARDIKKEDHSVLAIIGDGAMTGGMAFEAMNHAGHLGRNLIVILNDNEMSIAENVGGMARYLSKMRTDPKYSKGKEDIEQILRKIPSIGSTVFKAVDRIKDSLKYLVVPGMFFEELGFTYLGPIEGHNVKNMVDIFKQAKNSKGPVLVHVITRKGKGYLPAEENPDKFHGIGPFDIETGQTLKTSPIPSYTEVFGRTLNRLADKDQGIIAITAAMPSGTGLKGFAKKYPQRFFDVGIAEQHAVTMAAAMAKEGLRPVVAIYSTFLQRAYDQVLHDVCLQSLPVTFAIDRGGLVGDDGPTHHGVFDLSYLSHMPNMTVMAPKDENELQHMLATALKLPGPAALRYPRGSGRGVFMDKVPRELPLGRAEIIKEGGDVTFLALGPMVAMAQEAASMLAGEGIQAGVINARFIKPLDEECIIGAALNSKVLVTVEENVLAGGFGSAVLELLCARNIAGAKVLRMGLGDCFMEHGDREILLTVCNLNAASLAGAVLNSLAAKKNTLKFKLGFGTGGK